MNEQSRESFEERSRALFQDSVEGMDYALRSRLTQARAAAIASASGRRRWLARTGFWTPAAGVSAAALLGVFLWLGSPMGQHAGTVPDGQTNLEDLDIVASSDGNADPMDLLQDDIEFYDWADKVAGSGSPAAS